MTLVLYGGNYRYSSSEYHNNIVEMLCTYIAIVPVIMVGTIMKYNVEKAAHTSAHMAHRWTAPVQRLGDNGHDKNTNVK